jgi:hypothetical protein
MVLTVPQHDQVADFRQWMERDLNQAGRFGAPQREDRDDHSTLTTRWKASETLWVEVTVRPLIPQVRVGLVTDNRWISEEMEQAIEDSGDSMCEFVGLGFCDAGLNWDEPGVEHYREKLKWMCFVTPLELAGLDELASPETRGKVRKMVDGYCSAFAKFLIPAG